MSPVFDVTPWNDLVLVEPAAGGHRNEVWRARIADRTVAVRRSRRPGPSLVWELDLLDRLGQLGFAVPSIVAANDGRRSVDGVVVQTWLAGHEPAGRSDWERVAAELSRLHRETAGHRQRPGCVTVTELATARRSVDADLDALPPEVADRLLAVFEAFDDVPTSVIHGDPTPSNIRIGPGGEVGLLDWDESRVDLTWHDLSNLGVQTLDDSDHASALRLSNAWEAVNGWTSEPAYARRRLAALNDEP